MQTWQAAPLLSCILQQRAKIARERDTRTISRASLAWKLEALSSLPRVQVAVLVREYFVVVRFLMKNDDKPACSLIIRLFRLCIRFAFVECLFNYSYYLFCLRASERSRMKLDVILQLYLYIIKQIPKLLPRDCISFILQHQFGIKT